MGNWNRNKRRVLSRYGIGEEMVGEKFREQFDVLREQNYTYAWASMLMAVHEYYGANRFDMQHIAESTIDHINNSLCSEEVVQELKDLTGFDVHMRREQYDYDGEETTRTVVRAEDGQPAGAGNQQSGGTADAVETGTV